MNHIESIEKSLKDKLSLNEIVRKVYLTYPTSALVDKEEKQYEILNEISQHFTIPINHIQVCGSSKVGQSFHKVSTYTPKMTYGSFFCVKLVHVFRTFFAFLQTFL